MQLAGMAWRQRGAVRYAYAAAQPHSSVRRQRQAPRGDSAQAQVRDARAYVDVDPCPSLIVRVHVAPRVAMQQTSIFLSFIAPLATIARQRRVPESAHQ